MENVPSTMKTGKMHIYDIDNSFTKNTSAALSVLIKKSIQTGVHYVKCAGRTILTAEDMKIALMYEAHEYFKHEDLEEEIHAQLLETNESDESCSESDESCSENDESVHEIEKFTRAPDNDAIVKQMNYYYDTWDLWNPDDPLQKALKQSIDANFQQ